MTDAWPLHRRQRVARQLPWIALLAIAVLALSGVTDGSQRVGQHMQMADQHATGDVVLYRRIDERVASGQGYYQAAADLHREMHYPLRPFVTVRTPVLSWLYAIIGPLGLLVVAFGVIVIMAVAWNWRLATLGFGLATRAGAAAVLSLMGALGLDSQLICFHEVWAGLLISLALALPRQRGFAAQLTLGVAAVAIRELALPFLLLLGATAVWRREWSRAAMVAAACAALIAAWLLLHKPMVESVTTAADLASQGWIGLRGARGVAYDLAYLMGLGEVWRPLAIFVALVPLAGWLHYGERDGYFVFTLFAGFLAACAIFARVDNFYWVEVLLPAYFVGFVLLAHASVKSIGSALGLFIRTSDERLQLSQHDGRHENRHRDAH